MTETRMTPGMKNLLRVIVTATDSGTPALTPGVLARFTGRSADAVLRTAHALEVAGYLTHQEDRAVFSVTPAGRAYYEADLAKAHLAEVTRPKGGRPRTIPDEKIRQARAMLGRGKTIIQAAAAIGVDRRTLALRLDPDATERRNRRRREHYALPKEE